VVRSCKHLRKLRGDAAEDARLATVAAPTPKSDALQTAEAEAGRALRGDEKAALFGPPILLAADFLDAPDLDPTGWWMSEKLDGVRAYWNGQAFISRQGNEYKAPAWFTQGFPSHPLDGELWLARKAFQRTVAIVRRQDAGVEWSQLKYVTFDMPHLTTPFEDRMTALDQAHAQYISARGRDVKNRAVAWWNVLPQQRCTGSADMHTFLRTTIALGGEGIMLREPGSMYVPSRSATLLKVKEFHDAEAVVTGHTKGKGQHKGKTGALVVKMPNGNEFSIGTGLSAKDRANPPAIGATVTYRFTELTDGGIPKCASFVAVRDGY
jgi:DNA ligase-1